MNPEKTARDYNRFNGFFRFSVEFWQWEGAERLLCRNKHATAVAQSINFNGSARPSAPIAAPSWIVVIYSSSGRGSPAATFSAPLNPLPPTIPLQNNMQYVTYCLLNLVILAALFAVWVFFDVRRRKDKLMWVVGTLVMTPLLFPVYLARRRIVGREVRSGGPDWIVARHFVWVWSLFLAVVIFWTLLLTLSGEQFVEAAAGSSTADIERGQTVSRTVALFFLFLCWLLPAGAAFFLGPTMRDPDAISEYGPEAPRPEVEVLHME